MRIIALSAFLAGPHPVPEMIESTLRTSIALLLLAGGLAAAHAQEGGPSIAAAASGNPVSADAPANSGGAAGDESFWDRLHDAQDGKLDMSRYLLEHSGFLLVPIIITEPAVGNGGGAAALFFDIPEQSQASKDRGEHLPPNMYGFGLFKTENGSEGFGAAGSFHFNDDQWRYAAALSKASVNLDFYAQNPILGEHKIGYNLDGKFLFQEVARRIGFSDMLVSARWIYADIDNKLNVESDQQYFQPKQLDKISSGVGFGFEYDSRDNTLSPKQGWLSKVDATFYLPAIGSDDAYQIYRAHSLGYYSLSERWDLAVRADYRSAQGDVPFYHLPSIDLRGIAYGRYMAENVGMLEAELRFNITPRWTILGFSGAGRAWGGDTAFDDATTRTTRGVGFRYLLARALGLDVGVDWAWGPGSNAFYIQVGTAWR